MTRTTRLLLVAALLAGLGTAAWFLISFFASVLSSTSDGTRNLVLTALVCLLAWIGTRITKSLDDARSAHRERKVEVYSQFINAILTFIQSQTATSNSQTKTASAEVEGGSQGIDELTKALYQFQKDIILWGSPSVINAYTQVISQASRGGLATMLAVDRVMKEMRSDLGLSNSGLGDAGLVKVLLREPIELDHAIAVFKKTGVDVLSPR
jgi:apolipoprotein N-acyltransferase